MSEKVAAIKPRQLSLTPNQFTSLALVDHLIESMNITAQMAHRLGVSPLALAVAAAQDALKKAHEAYVDSTQRTISIAAPSDVARLVQP